jgi:hypothetical protein
MKLLKDERVVALNDAITLCLDAARLYAALAEASQDRALARRLQAVAERRKAAAARLSLEVRRLGELPAAPPQEERVLLESAVARLKAELAPERDRQLREELHRKEVAVRQAAERLPSLDIDPEARAAAEELVRDSAAELSP